MNDHLSVDIDRNQRKIGPIWLMPGVLPKNVATLFFSAAMAIGFVNLINLIQPLLLKEQLGMTEGEGDFTANLYVVLEITTLLVAAPLANLSDMIGRRPIFTAGFILVCLGLVIIPTSTTQGELMTYRIIMSVGVACCTTMIAALAADYPQNVSRGKFIGLNGVFTAFGVIGVGSGLTLLPAVFTRMGYSPAVSISYTMWIGSALALAAAIICYAGTRKRHPVEREHRLSFRENARIGLAEIRSSSKLLLACVATLLSRGDLTVLATFFSLWVVKVGATMPGIEPVDAMATAGKLFGLMQIAMLLFMPVIAFIADRLDRVTTLSIAIALAALGYFALAVSPNPYTSNLIYLVVVLAGIGEAAILVSVPSLLGQEAPVLTRGAIIGVAASFGAVGIILTNKVSGHLFDNYGFQTPFMFMAGLNFAIFFWAIAVRVISGPAKKDNHAA
jgi:MFS family permease